MEVRVVDHPLAAARLTWSDTSSKSGRPAKDFESWETVSITQSAQCSLVQRLAQHLNPRINQPSLNLSSRAKSRDLWSYGLAGTNQHDGSLLICGFPAKPRGVILSRHETSAGS